MTRLTGMRVIGPAATVLLAGALLAGCSEARSGSAGERTPTPAGSAATPGPDSGAGVLDGGPLGLPGLDCPPAMNLAGEISQDAQAACLVKLTPPPRRQPSQTGPPRR